MRDRLAFLLAVGLVLAAAGVAWLGHHAACDPGSALPWLRCP